MGGPRPKGFVSTKETCRIQSRWELVEGKLKIAMELPPLNLNSDQTQRVITMYIPDCSSVPRRLPSSLVSIQGLLQFAPLPSLVFIWGLLCLRDLTVFSLSVYHENSYLISTEAKYLSWHCAHYTHLDCIRWDSTRFRRRLVFPMLQIWLCIFARISDEFLLFHVPPWFIPLAHGMTPVTWASF